MDYKDLLDDLKRMGHYERISHSNINGRFEEAIRSQTNQLIEQVRSGAGYRNNIGLEERENLAFLMERMYRKLPDANFEILARFCAPLLDNPMLREVNREYLDVRIVIDNDDRMYAYLCNHGGPGGCDCGEHPFRDELNM